MAATVVATLLVAIHIAASPAQSQTLPAGFVEDVVVSGLDVPVAMAFLPDGRTLVVEKGGVVRVVKNGSLLPTPFIDLSSRVNDYWDRGMLGIAVDPDFTTNGHVYLYYVYENDPAVYDGPKTARLTRVTASGDTAAPASEVVILGSMAGPSCGGMPAGSDCIPADSPSHNGGSITFAPDGTIFLTTGDGSSFNMVDEMALRAQSVDSLSGKLLHITRAGQGISTNPFWNGNASAIRSKVWSLGLRNPFRGTLRPGGGQPYIGDVGWSLYEEVNVATAGANLGWPCYEGPNRQAGYEGLSTCQTLYAQGPSAVRSPLTSYAHDGVTASITGGVFYTGTGYPTAYQSAYFFGDYARGFIKYMQVNASDGVVGAVNDFSSGVPGPVQIAMGPDGWLYYVAINTGEVRRIRYVPVTGGGGTTSLSTLAWTSATNGWGPVERDMSNGEQAQGDGRPITLAGRVYARGLGVHAVSEIHYQLNGQCTSFQSDIGIDDEVADAGSVVFQVWADGTKLYDSGVMTGATSTIHVSQDIAGRRELVLIVTNGGDTTSFDHADWADPTITCSGSSGSSLFAPAVGLPAGTNTHSVSIVDLNADGRADLVAANAGSSTASVWLGKGDGTFGARADLATGSAPKHIGVADLNKDGRPDLVSANQDASSVSVLLAGNGGAFLPAVNYPVCANAHESAIADFNRDGSLDVMVACWGGSVVSFLPGRGDGTLGSRVDIPAGANPHSVVAADFNGDGFLDAAIANHGSADVSVLLGRGDGTFAGQARYGVGGGPHSIRTGDIDKDGRVDLVTANDETNNVSVLRGRADGTFNPATQHAVGSVPKGVALADVNADGSLDVLTANTAGNYPTCCNPGGDTITLLAGNGDGTFGASSTYTVGLTPFSVAAGDLDGDGDLDVVTANWHSNSVSILKNLGGGDPPPSIGNVTAVAITSSGATITWTTSEPADAQVEYGLSTSYGATSTLQTSMSASHSVTLSGLQGGTVYHYRVRSRDAGGNLAVSPDFTFTTSGTTSSTTIYVSDLTWTSMTNAWGAVERDRSNGEQGDADGGVITLNGVTYAKGLGTHAASDVRYAIPSGCTQFRSDIGVDDEVGNNGSVTFQVWGDATRLFESAPLLGASATGTVTVDLTGRSQLRLVVTDGGNGIAFDHGDWAGARLICSGGATPNTPPTATITAPAPTLLFKVGDVISYSGSATDTEDGGLAPSRLNWSIVLHHCPEGSCHTHPFTTGTGATGSFTVPDHGDESFFELVLTATDSAGATGTASRTIQPQTVQLTFDTLPAGLQTVYDGVARTTPFTRPTIVGSTHTISAPSPQGTSVFSSWSDGGAQQHNISAGTTNARYTANFTQPADTTAPVISDVTASGVTASAASIGWTTNEPADGQVQYGVTVGYGSTTALATARTTSHSASLSGLQADTLYHYRVLSRDAAGNLATSNDFTFTTTGASSGATIYLSDLAWTSMTNGWGSVERDRSNGEQGDADGGVITLNGITYAKGLGTHATSDVRYTIPSGCTQFRSDIGIDDEVGNNGSVTFQVWGDTIRLFESAPLLGTSATGTVTVDLTGRTELRLVVTDGGNGIAFDHGDWAGARLICAGGATPNSPPTATITAPAATLLFKVGDVISYSGSATDGEDGALAASRLAWNIVTHHCDGGCHTHPFSSSTGATGSFTVPDHGDGTFFELVLIATDSAGATATASRTIQPQTVQLTLDTVPAGLQVVYDGVTQTAPFTRTTIVGSTHTINTASPQGNNVFSSWSDGGAQQHSVTVGATNARYTATFTQAPDTTGPVISGVASSNVTTTAATITWTTSEPADGQVQYGLTTSYGSTTPLVTARTTSHSITISGLQPSTNYQFRVLSRDAAGNLSTSGNFTVRTKKR
jgi:glucose/arabinose dehydrogenase/chitodextrinase